MDDALVAADLGGRGVDLVHLALQVAELLGQPSARCVEDGELVVGVRFFVVQGINHPEEDHVL